MRSPIIVCDVDEVIFNIAPKWVKKMIHNEKLFTRIRNLKPIIEYNNSEERLIKCVNERDEYNLLEWLQLPKISHGLAMSLYRDDPNFYKDLEITKFGLNLKANPTSRRIVFVSHVLGGLADDSKREMLDYYFNGCNYSYYPVYRGFNKSDKIMEVCPDFDVFVDDNVGNMLDVMQKCGKPGMKFIYPALGYNALAPVMLSEVVAEKKLDLGCI